MEVAGLVFGVLPLLVSATESFRSTSRVLHRWIKYDHEVNAFQSELKFHEAFFRTEFSILIGNITGWEVIEVEERLNSGYDQRWITPELEVRFVNYLGSNRETVKDTMESMNQSLAHIRDKSAKFNDVARKHESESPESRTTRVALITTIKTKLDFSFSGKDLREKLERLDKLNQRLSRQLDQVKRAQPGNPSQFPVHGELRRANTMPESHTRRPPLQDITPPTPVPIEREIESTTTIITKTARIRKAVEGLYEALWNACKVHQEHAAYFKLVGARVDDLEPAIVRFDVVLQAIMYTHGDRFLSPVGFGIASAFPAIYHDSHDENELVVLQKKRKRESESSFEFADEINRRHRFNENRNTDKDIVLHEGFPIQENLTVHEENSVQEDIIVQEDIGFFSDAKIRPVLGVRTLNLTSNLPHRRSQSRVSSPDRPGQGSFCNQVRLRLQEPRNAYKDDFIGFLDVKKEIIHRVLYPTHFPQYETPISLPELLQRLKQKHTDGLLPVQTVSLAKQIASAVLHFGGSSLMTESWAGGNIVFFMPSNLVNSRPDITSPYLKAHIKSRPNKGQSPPTARIQNIISLGKILIELSYQTSLRELRETEDIAMDDGEENNKNTEFNTSNRVIHTMSKLGPRYKKVVKRCLSCDSGEAFYDLSKPKGHDTFEKDVIHELERIEMNLEKSQAYVF